MKRLRLPVTFIFVFLSSCQNSNQPIPINVVETHADTIKKSIVLPIHPAPAAPKGFTKTVEKRIRQQLESFMQALNSGDKAKVVELIYPGAFEFLKDKYPDQNVEMLVDKLLTSQMAQMKEFTEKNNASYKYELGSLNKQTIDGSTFICTVPTKLLTHTDQGDDSEDGEVICISENNGQSWKFLENDDIEKSKIVIRNNFSAIIYNRLFE